MSSLYEKATEVLIEKEDKIIPENIKKGVKIFDVEGTVIPVTNHAKVFESTEEMHADTTAINGDLGIVYGENLSPITESTEFDSCFLPKTVVLEEPCTTTISAMFEMVDSSSSFYVDVSVRLTSTSFSMEIYNMDGMTTITYESLDGITYTKTNGEEETVNFGAIVKYYNWSGAAFPTVLGNFIIASIYTYQGLYQYNTSLVDSNKLYTVSPNNCIIDSWDETNDTITAAHFSKRNDSYYDLDLLRTIIANSDVEYGYNETVAFYYNTSDQLCLIRSADHSSDPATRLVYTKDSGNTLIGFAPRITSGLNVTCSAITYLIDLTNFTFTQLNEYPAVLTGRQTHYEITDIKTVPIAYSTRWNNIMHNPKDLVTKDGSTYGSTIVPDTKYYYSDYILAPTQLTLSSADQLWPEIIAYGKHGVITGTNEIYNKISIMDLICQHGNFTKYSKGLYVESNVDDDGKYVKNLPKTVENFAKTVLYMRSLPFTLPTSRRMHILKDYVFIFDTSQSTDILYIYSNDINNELLATFDLEAKISYTSSGTLLDNFDNRIVYSGGTNDNKIATYIIDMNNTPSMSIHKFDVSNASNSLTNGSTIYNNNIYTFFAHNVYKNGVSIATLDSQYSRSNGTVQKIGQYFIGVSSYSNKIYVKTINMLTDEVATSIITTVDAYGTKYCSIMHDITTQKWYMTAFESKILHLYPINITTGQMGSGIDITLTQWDGSTASVTTKSCGICETIDNKLCMYANRTNKSTIVIDLSNNTGIVYTVHDGSTSGQSYPVAIDKPYAWVTERDTTGDTVNCITWVESFKEVVSTSGDNWLLKVSYNEVGATHSIYAVMNNSVPQTTSISPINIVSSLTEPNSKKGLWIQSNKTFALTRLKEGKEGIIWDTMNFEKLMPNETSSSDGLIGVVGNSAYLLGFPTDGYYDWDIYEYNFLTNEFIKKLNVQNDRVLNTLKVVIGTDIYIIGSQYSGSCQRMGKYDTIANTFTKLTNIPYYFYNGGAAYYNGYIYLSGSDEDASTYRNFYRYSVANDAYEKLVDLPNDNYKINRSICIDGLIYIITPGQPLLIYNPNTNTMTTTDVIVPSQVSTACHPFIIDGEAYMLYWYADVWATKFATYKFSPKTLEFINLNAQSTAFYLVNRSATVYNNEIYLFGVRLPEPYGAPSKYVVKGSLVDPKYDINSLIIDTSEDTYSSELINNVETKFKTAFVTGENGLKDTSINIYTATNGEFVQIV